MIHIIPLMRYQRTNPLANMNMVGNHGFNVSSPSPSQVSIIVRVDKVTFSGWRLAPVANLGAIFLLTGCPHSVALEFLHLLVVFATLVPIMTGVGTYGLTPPQRMSALDPDRNLLVDTSAF